MHFIQQQQTKAIKGIYRGSYIGHICTTKRTEFIALFLEITCVHYILLDNRDLQSYQVGLGKDVAITTLIISENFRQNYKPMKLQLSVPELSTSAPYGGDNEGLGMVHTERTGEWKLLTSSHHKPSSQRIDTWQPTDREDAMPSWTGPTLGQLIIRFNARKSWRNNVILKWKKNLTPNLEENKTHMSTRSRSSADRRCSNSISLIKN